MPVRFFPVSSAPDEALKPEPSRIAEVVELRTKLAPQVTDAREEARVPAFDRAVRVLARRALSQHELATQLRREGYRDEVIAETLEQCVNRGYLDDEALAQRTAERLRVRKRLGRNAIRAQLLGRGLRPELVESVLHHADHEDEYEALLSLALPKAKSLRSVDRVTAERRLSGYLARRGYSGSQLREVTRIALDEAARIP